MIAKVSPSSFLSNHPGSFCELTASSFPQLPPEGKSWPPSLSLSIHHPHSSAPLLPTLELAPCSFLFSSSKTEAFLASQPFSFICPSPNALHEVFPAAWSPSTALFATPILEFPLHPCLHMPMACSSSGRIWSQLDLPLSSYLATFCSRPGTSERQP